MEMIKSPYPFFERRLFMYKNLFNDEDSSIVSWNMNMGCLLYKTIAEALELQKYNRKSLYECWELTITANQEYQNVYFKSDGTMLIEREMCDCFGRCMGYDDLYVEFVPELNDFN